MTKPTTITPENVAKIKTLHDEMQKLHDLTRQNRHAPLQELQELTATLSNEIQTLFTQHKRAIAELEEKQSNEMKALRNKDKLTRDQLEKSVGAVDAHFKKESDRINKEAKPLLQGITLTEMIALIPEDVRPTLIETADHPGEKMFILQHKLAPECGFLIWAEEGHDTKWSIYLQNLLSGVRRHLVCFCGNGCMTNESRALLVNSLAKTCNEHGIKTLLGRKVSEDKDGVQFREGSYFHDIENGFPDDHLTKWSNHFVSFCG